MNYIKKIHNKLRKKNPARLLDSIDAYKLWAQSYDEQPLNVVLFLESKLFSEIISNMDLSGKIILDFGCGTGRHWEEIYKQSPHKLIGIDNSDEMLNKLKQKFINAETYLSTNNSLNKIVDISVDMIISTLTIGHIKDIEKIFEEWNRVLKPNGGILITDFHPEAFRTGMKRTFTYEGETIEVENYFYGLEFLKQIFFKTGWELISIHEKIIDEETKHLFEKQNYLSAYNKYKGMPLILGMSLKKK